MTRDRQRQRRHAGRFGGANPTHAMRPHEWGTRFGSGIRRGSWWSSRWETRGGYVTVKNRQRHRRHAGRFGGANPTHAMRPHEWGTRFGWGTRHPTPGEMEVGQFEIPLLPIICLLPDLLHSLLHRQPVQSAGPAKRMRFPSGSRTMKVLAPQGSFFKV